MTDSKIAQWVEESGPRLAAFGVKSLPVGFPVLVCGEQKVRPSETHWHIDLLVPRPLSHLFGDRLCLFRARKRVEEPPPHFKALDRSLGRQRPARTKLGDELDELLSGDDARHNEEARFAVGLYFVPPKPDEKLRAVWSGPVDEARYGRELEALEARSEIDERLEHDRRVSLERDEATRAIEQLQQWGLRMDSTETSSASGLGISPARLHERLRDAGLEYHPSTVAEFLAALDTHLLVILSGPPGYGKTRLVAEVGKLDGVQLTTVRVRPSWHDPADLLGYRNLLNPDRQPHTTDFARSLLAAEQNPDVLHLVLLDELNLAPVEHYFADFLSLLERRDRGKTSTDPASRVPLNYSWPGSGLLEEEHQPIGPEPDAPHLYREVVASLRDRLNQYEGLDGSSVTLPPNLRVVGTVNIDATVELLSPRVVDRSVVVQVGRRREVGDGPEVRLSSEVLQLRPLDELPGWGPGLEALGEQWEDVERDLKAVEGGLEGLGWGVQLSPRRRRQAALMADSLAKVLSSEGEEPPKLILDSLVRTLALPRLMDLDKERCRKALEGLDTALRLTGCLGAQAELTALLDRPHPTISYWMY
jgi:hypothetical protein